MKGKSLSALFVVSFTGLGHAESSAESVLSLNDAALVTRSAVVVLTDEFFSGQTKALKILFTPERLTEEQRLESLRDDGRALRKKDHESDSRHSGSDCGSYSGMEARRATAILC